MAFKFAFITDTHFYPNAPHNFGTNGSQLEQSSEAIYTELLRELEAFRPDFVIHGGDAVCGGDSFSMTSSAYKQALTSLHRLEQTLPFPVYHIPGNHDLDPESGSREAYLEVFGHAGKGHICFDHEGWRFILLDAQEVPRDLTHGHIGADQLAWLETQLKSAGGMKVLLFVHQLLVKLFPDQGPGALVDNADAVLACLEGSREVVACFQGHSHLNAVIQHQESLYVVTSAMVEYPMMWREIFVSDDELIVRSHQLECPELVEQSAAAVRSANEQKLGPPRARQFTLSVKPSKQGVARKPS